MAQNDDLKDKGTRKRVLIVSEYFHPHWTGIAKTFLDFAKLLKSEGHEVLVLTNKYADELPGNEVIDGIEIKRSPCSFHISRTYYSYKILLDFIKLAPKYDVVILNSPFSNILFITILSKVLCKKTIIYHQGDFILPNKTGSKLSKFIMENVFDFLTISAMALADVTSSFTEDYARNSRVLKYFTKKFRASIPSVQLSNEAPSPQFKEKMRGLAENRLLVGFAGRFVEEKGFDILLEAVPLIIEKVPNAHFVFAGEINVVYEKFYDLNVALINKNKDRVHILGLLKENDLHEFYRHLSTFVISSRSDCFTLTQIEAAKCGIPLVVTNIPGARMLVKESGFGELAETENAKSLADSIIKVLTNRNHYLNKQQNALQFLKSYEQFRLD